MDIINSDLFLQLLLKSHGFSEYIINKYPEIEADIASYRMDSGCSCRHKITKYFDINRQSITKDINEKLVNTHIGEINLKSNNHRNVLKPSLPSTEWSKYKDVIGQIMEISPDPLEYKKIISIAREEWFYNGINILETIKLDPQTKKESIVWLLLFY